MVFVPFVQFSFRNPGLGRWKTTTTTTTTTTSRKQWANQKETFLPSSTSLFSFTSLPDFTIAFSLFFTFCSFFFLTFHTKSCLVLLRVLWFNYCLLVFPIEMSRIQISPFLIIEFSKKKNHGFNFFTKPTH